MQTAFERTARHWRRVVRSGNPEAYARRVLVNLAIDDTRRRRRKPLLPGGGVQELERIGGAAPDRRIADLELRDLVERSLAALPPRQRAVLVLRYWCDLTEREIAADLGVSAGTVKSQGRRRRLGGGGGGVGLARDPGRVPGAPGARTHPARSVQPGDHPRTRRPRTRPPPARRPDVRPPAHAGARAEPDHTSGAPAGHRDRAAQRPGSQPFPGADGAAGG